MTVQDLDLKRELAVIRRGKGGKGRVAPLGPKSVADTDRYLRMRRSHRLAETPTLWLGDRGKGLSWGLSSERCSGPTRRVRSGGEGSS